MDTQFLPFEREFATDFIAVLKENILTFASCENCISDKQHWSHFSPKPYYSCWVKNEFRFLQFFSKGEGYKDWMN